MGMSAAKQIVMKIEATKRALIRGARRAVETTVLNIEARAKAKLRDVGGVDQGVARASIQSSVSYPSEYVILGTVTVGAAHAQWIEYGRKGLRSNPPGIKDGLSAEAAWPPIDVIDAWVRRKIGISAPRVVLKSRFYQRYPEKKKARVAQIKQSAIDKEARKITFLVSRKIALYGIAPRPFFGPVARDEVRKFNRRSSSMIQIELKGVL